MQHFTIEELCRSSKAQLFGIRNVPNEVQKRNMEHLVEHTLDPLREAWKAPLIVTSGFRCKELNAKVGGVNNSQHTTGEAADIVPKNLSDIGKLYKLAMEVCDYDQLLLEYNKSNGRVRCLHISCKRDAKQNRHYSNGHYLL